MTKLKQKDKEQQVKSTESSSFAHPLLRVMRDEDDLRSCRGCHLMGKRRFKQFNTWLRRRRHHHSTASEGGRSAGSCVQQFNVATFGGNVALVRGRPPRWSSAPPPSSSLKPFILQKGQRNEKPSIFLADWFYASFARPIELVHQLNSVDGQTY